MWQGKKSFVSHAHTDTHLHTSVCMHNMNMFVYCTYVHMYVQQSGQKAKGENFLMVIDGDTSGVVRNVGLGGGEGRLQIADDGAGSEVVKEAEQLAELLASKTANKLLGVQR